MKCASECTICAINNLNRILDRFVAGDEAKTREMKNMLRHLSDFDFDQPPVEMLRYFCDHTPRLTGGEDFYAEQKSRDNRNMLNQYDVFYSRIKAHPDPFRAAVLLSIAGNIIDYGYDHGRDMDDVIQGALNHQMVVDHVDEMMRALKVADNILYVLDNAGEIVADKLMISFLIENGILDADRVTAVVRGMPTLNDATMADAREVGLTGLVNVIDNGDNIPGTTLSRCSETFLEHYNRADVIISKGMGNFESFHYLQDKVFFFLLMSKCANVARTLGVPLHSYICKASYL